jgi:hypothetical protein
LRAPAFGATRKPIRTSQLAGIASESNVDDALQRTLPVPTDDLSWKVLSAMRSDTLALFHERDHDTPLAVWRMRFADAASAQAMLELAAWPESIEARRDDRDVILLASAAVEDRALLADLRFQSTPTISGVKQQSASALAGAPGAHLISAASPRSR